VRRRAIAALVVLVAATAPVARADGDPASDFLVGQNVFFGLAQPPSAAMAELQSAVDEVYAHNLRMRVAVIGSKTDLGSVPSLYGRPATYAKFLGLELRSYYVGPLLVVMPAGFGIYDGGRSTAAEASVLARRRAPGRTPAELTRAAAATVHALRIAGALRSKDVLAPAAATFSGSASTGDSMKLRYTVADDSGRAAVELSVLAGRRRLAKLDVPMRRVDGRKTYFVRWRVTSGLATAAARLCITARDPSGNRSRQFCTPIELQASAP
jgi:hypothetical protein